MEAEEIKPKVNPVKKKRKSKQDISLYKEQKIGVHTTVNGKGIVGRLIDNK